jgi:hypothetical protein
MVGLGCWCYKFFFYPFGLAKIARILISRPGLDIGLLILIAGLGFFSWLFFSMTGLRLLGY